MPKQASPDESMFIVGVGPAMAHVGIRRVVVKPC